MIRSERQLPKMARARALFLGWENAAGHGRAEDLSDAPFQCLNAALVLAYPARFVVLTLQMEDGRDVHWSWSVEDAIQEALRRGERPFITLPNGERRYLDE